MPIVEGTILAAIVSAALLEPVTTLLVGAAAADAYTRLPRTQTLPNGAVVEVEDFLDDSGAVVTDFTTVTVESGEELLLSRAEYEAMQFSTYLQQTGNPAAGEGA